MNVKNGNKYGLKDHYILAQGKRSVALVWKTIILIVRALSVIQDNILFRTREKILYIEEIISYNSVRKRMLALFIDYFRTVFPLHIIPRETFRIVPSETLPWAELYWPFSPRLWYNRLGSENE